MSFVHSIKFRFTVWYLLVLAVLLAALSTGVYFYMSRTLYNNLDHSLELRASELRNIRGVLSSIGGGEFQEELGEVVILYLKRENEVASVSPRNVSVTLDPQVVQQALDGRGSYGSIHMADKTELRFYIAPLRPEVPAFFPGGPGAPMGAFPVESAAILVGRSTEDIEVALDGLIRTLVIAVPLTLAVAGGGGVFLAGRALKPVGQMARIAQDIEESDLSRRIPVQSKDELGRLASTLNQMIQRLEKAFKRQRQFTGDASHELRTPLTVIQAEATLALEKERPASEYRQSLDLVSHEAKHMSRVIDQLLTLARADSGNEHLLLEEIELRDLLVDLSVDAEILCRDKGLEFRLEPMGSVRVKGDRARLRELFLNLLGNAIRYTPSGGTVSLSLTRDGDTAVAAVTDTGIGIPEKDIPLIFERFYRVDKARARQEGGAGLGLAICRHIAEVHGGAIKVESHVGTGSTFSVWLPIVNQ